MIEWIQHNQSLLWLLAASSIALFIASLIVAPVIAIKIPADYFTRSKRDRHLLHVDNQALAMALNIARNALGYIFIVAGLLMLVLPGQGVMTILFGIILADFPGKHRLVMWLVRRGSVIKSINWIRKRAGAEPLKLEERQE